MGPSLRELHDAMIQNETTTALGNIIDGIFCHAAIFSVCYVSDQKDLWELNM